MENIKNILVRVPNWIGDAVFCEPSIKSIKNNFTHSNITILARPWVAPLFLNNTSVSGCIEYDPEGIHRGIAGRIRLIKTLRKKQYDLAILFQNAFDAAFLTFIARIPERWGYSTDGRGFLLTKSVRVTGDIKTSHEVFYYKNLLKQIGLNVDIDLKPKLYISDIENEFAERFLMENGLTSARPITGINPGASYGKAKRWLSERFAGVAGRLMNEYRAQIIIFGSKGDAAECREVAEGLKGDLINLCGRTNLRELISLIKRCSLFITNDSGPMHISASLGVPTVAVFGSTDPRLTAPLGENVSVIKKDMECSPCFERECRYGHYECLKMVTVDDVLAASVRFLRAGVNG
ncbi:MAG: lipopolysaccharide heptosyltransferase II [Deltaproteobacteria bacterium GWC2_42_11]|nr:MAG: lipopolysaccharide heptosyltransferase II [Deltaproteobacteria bacterium GWC2_42_11]